MTDNEFLLADRIAKIQSVIRQYGEENFYLSFSGGKDSTALSYLLDMAIPNNKIPRVYANTGIEYKMIVDFVKDMQKKDDRIVILRPAVPIKPTLEKEGYPFKSKHHSEMWKIYERNPTSSSVLKYANREYNFNSNKCPYKLQYQFSQDYKGVKISDMCCLRLKEEPLKKWQKESNKPYGILGIMKEEGGRRESAVCMAFEDKKLKNFQPLVVVSKEWETWFIEEHHIEICDIYKPPYNFDRTGCKGCPFNPHLQKDLDVLERFFPEERKQCETLWKPVYDEYRRIGYRLKKKYEHQITIDEWLKG